MNAQRRKTLAKLASAITLTNADAQALASIKTALETAQEDLADVKGDEQEAYDNMPEGLQSGERGEQSQSAIEAMDTATTLLEELSGWLDEFEDKLQEVRDAFDEAAA